MSDTTALQSTDQGARGTKPLPDARLIPHTLLMPSPTQPRRHFDASKMAELRESIRVHKVRHPLIVRVPDVRPPEGQPQYEIVEGERRWRNVCEIAAGGPAIDLPCIVSDISATLAREIQLLSAIQREELHPLDEADGFEALLADPPGVPPRLTGFSLDELAHRAGKKPAYVRQRLRLCGLTNPAARKAFYAGEIGIGTALSLARLKPKEQAEAVAVIVKGSGSGPMAHDEAQRHIERTYMLRLNLAPWDLHDDTLLPPAGSCTACPKRSGSNPELFAEISTADTCTDKQCYQDKAKALRTRTLRLAKASKYTIISGDSAQAMLPSAGAPIKGHVRLDAPCPDLALSTKPLRELLGDEFEQRILIDNEAIGAMVEVAPISAVKRALRGKGLLREEPKAAGRGKDSTNAPKAAPASTAPVAPAKAKAQAPAAAEAPAPAAIADEDLALLEKADRFSRVLPSGRKTPPTDAEMRAASKRATREVRAVLTACAIGRQMRGDGAEGLPSVGLEHMLLALLLAGGGMYLTLPLAAQVAGVPDAPTSGSQKAEQAWAEQLKSEDACRLVMVLLALQDPGPITAIESFPVQAARALGTSIGYVDEEAQRWVRSRVQLELVAIADAQAKAKKAKAGAAPAKKAPAKKGKPS